MDQIKQNLKQIKDLVTSTGHKYLSQLAPMSMDEFKKEAKSFIKLEKIILKLIKKLQ